MIWQTLFPRHLWPSECPLGPFRCPWGLPWCLWGEGGVSLKENSNKHIDAHKITSNKIVRNGIGKRVIIICLNRHSIYRHITEEWIPRKRIGTDRDTGYIPFVSFPQLPEVIRENIICKYCCRSNFKRYPCIPICIYLYACCCTCVVCCCLYNQKAQRMMPPLLRARSHK